MSNDEAIFLALVDEHGSSVLALLRRLCGRDRDADDLFQEVAVRVWRSLRSRPGPRNARSWLMTIAYRVYLDHQTRPRITAIAWDEEPVARGGASNDPAVLSEQKERRDLLEAAVAEISAPIRAVIILHYTGGLSLKQVAATMGVSVGTVKSRLNSGLEQLRRRCHEMRPI